RADLLGGHTALLELGAQGPARQSATVMARFDPRPGKGGVVNQADVLEPAQHRVGRLVRDAALAQRVGELGPRPGREREQPQAYLPGSRLRVIASTVGPALAVFRQGGVRAAVSPDRAARE